MVLVLVCNNDGGIILSFVTMLVLGCNGCSKSVELAHLQLRHHKESSL